MIIKNFKLKHFLRQDVDLIKEYIVMLQYLKSRKTKRRVFHLKLKQVEFIKSNLYSNNDRDLIKIIKFVQGIKDKKPLFKFIPVRNSDYRVYNMPIIEFFGLVASVKEQLNTIHKAESNSLTPSEINLKWEMVEGDKKMSKFGIYNTLENLSGGNALKYKKYLNMEYSDIFTILLMRKTSSELKREMDSIKTKAE